MIPGLEFKYRVLFVAFVFMSYKSYYYFGNHILNKYNLRKGEKHGNGDHFWRSTFRTVCWLYI